MQIRFVEIHPADSPKALNSEFFVLKNEGETSFSTKNCAVFCQKRGQRKATSLGTMEPGFTIAPGGEVRVVTGNPGKKVHGPMPEGVPDNYSLFLAGPVLRGPGTVLSLKLRSMEVASAEFDPAATRGVKTKSPS